MLGRRRQGGTYLEEGPLGGADELDDGDEGKWDDGAEGKAPAEPDRPAGVNVFAVLHRRVADQAVEEDALQPKREG